MKFYFLNTCYACPEQYDVYRTNGDLCGYIRLRWGLLIAEYPDVNEEVIYQYRFTGDDFKSSFEDDEERNYYLKQIAIAFQDRILYNITSSITNTDCSYEILTDISQLEERLNYEQEKR